jgi:hypothetical protein
MPTIVAPTKAWQDGKCSSIPFLVDILVEIPSPRGLGRSFPVPADGGDFGPGLSGSRDPGGQVFADLSQCRLTEAISDPGCQVPVSK